MSKRGFSLIEVLLVVALMGVTALAFLSLFQTQTMALNAMRFSLARNDLQREVSQHLAIQNGQCKCAFGGTTPLSIAVDGSGNPTTPAIDLTGALPALKVFDTASSCVTTTGTVFQVGANEGEFKVSSWSVVNIQKMTAGSVYRGDVKLKLSPTKQVSGPQDLTAVIPGIVFNTSLIGSNAKVVDCNAVGIAPSMDLTPLDVSPAYSISIPSASSRSFHVTNDSSIKGVILGLVFAGGPHDLCLAVLNTTETRSLYIVGGGVHDGSLTESGGIVIAPVDASGNVHFRNETQGDCNPSHNVLSATYSVLSYLH